MKKLGILAGRGPLPAKVASVAQERGWDVLILGFKGFADFNSFKSWPNRAVYLGEVGKIVSILKRYDCHDIVMIGGVDRPHLLNLHADWQGWKILRQWGRHFFSGDNKLLTMVVRYFQEKGFSIHGADSFLKEDVLLEGCLTKKSPTEQDMRDIDLGKRLIDAMGRFDVGQACVVQRGVVLAIEAMEGTDEMIKRAGCVKQAGSGGVLVKCAKPQQERRVDMPVIGEETVRNVTQAGLAGIAFNPSNTLLIDPEKTRLLANDKKIFMWGISA